MEEKMVRIILHGCSGRMGHIITEICAEDDQVQIVAGVDAFGDAYADYPVFRKVPGKSFRSSSVRPGFRRNRPLCFIRQPK